MDYRSRQQKFKQTIAAERLDGFVVTHPANLHYLCGYTGSNGLLLFADDKRTFFTDGRYTEQARQEVEGPRIVIAKASLMKSAAESLPAGGKLRIGFEADHLSVAAAGEMHTIFAAPLRLKASSGLVMRQRVIKDAEEVRLIRAAVQMGVDVFQEALATLRPGVPESTVAGTLEFAARKAGAEGMSFDTIVAGGKRAALPHGRASADPIPSRGFVVVDSGVILRGYCSDLTRTVHVGRIGREELKWYEAVLEAQLAAIAAVKPGISAGEVDKAARSTLRRAKLDRYFTHSTGHGVGLEIHEPPRLGKEQSEPLQAGMVVTVEPGVYVPGRGGIRIEDMVLVTPTGCEVLTPLAKELVEV